MPINQNGQPQLTQEQAQQILQILQQNGQNPPMMANWNMPTNPMAALWMANMMGMMNNQNQNTNQSQQNQNNQPAKQPQQQENTEPAVRVIKTPDEIKADEIPMNGSIRLFLQEDMNVIYGKRWTNNGVIENIRYIREDPTPQQEQTQNPMDEFVNRISQMMDQKLDEFKKEYIDKPETVAPRTVAKKGANKDGE